MLINVLGVLYIVFVLDEVKPRAKDDIEERLPETELTHMLTKRQSLEQATTVVESVPRAESNKCISAIKDCVTVIVRKRSGNGRKIVCLTLAIAGLAQVLEHGI